MPTTFMPRALPRFAWLILPLLLSACAGTTPRLSKVPATPVLAAPEAAAPTSAATQAGSRHAHAVDANPPHTESPAQQRVLPEYTGIPVCDIYLSTYKACHRAAHIYKPSAIDAHYQAMRRSLLEQSLDPDIRTLLPSRCKALARSLKQALHGKSCDFPKLGPPKGSAL